MRPKNVLIVALVIVALASISTTASAAAYKPSDAEIHRDNVLSKIVAWRTKSAETTLKKAPELEESQPYLTAEAFLMATYSLGKNENFVAKALAILEKQVKKDPNDPVAEFYRGEVLRWLDRKDEAKKAWQKTVQKANTAISENSRNGTAYYYKGAAQVRLKNAEDARKTLKKATKNEFDPTMVNFQLGLAYMLQENWKAAKAAFDDVHEFDPRYAHLYFYRGIASEKLGRKDLLLDDLDQFVKLAPNSPEAKTARAILRR